MATLSEWDPGHVLDFRSASQSSLWAGAPLCGCRGVKGITRCERVLPSGGDGDVREALPVSEKLKPV